MVDPAAEQIRNIAEATDNAPVAIFFSCGKDSIVSAELLQNYPGPKHYFFFYLTKGLEINERVLRWYESRWSCEIHRLPNEVALSLKTGKKFKFGDLEKLVRKEFDLSWIVLGMRRDESLPRRGMLANCQDGIDERNRKIYPVADWSAKKVMSYIRMNRLVLPPEYQQGLKRNITTVDPDLLIYIRNNYPGDYQKIIEEFPQMEAGVWALTN